MNVPKRPTSKYGLDLSSYQINSLTKPELARVVQSLASTANKRIKRLEAANLDTASVVYQQLIEEGGKFSTKGKDRSGLIMELYRARRFLNAKTSRLPAAREQREHLVKFLGAKYEPDLERQILQVFNRLKRDSAAIFNKYYDLNADTGQVIAEYVESNQDKTTEELKEDLEGLLFDSIKEEQLQEEALKRAKRGGSFVL